MARQGGSSMNVMRFQADGLSFSLVPDCEDEDPDAPDAAPVPRCLELRSPNGRREAAGVYELIGEANAQPLWRLGDCYLYAGLSGRWCVGTDYNRRRDFQTSSGMLRQAEEHLGRPPHLVSGLWSRRDGKEELLDPEVLCLDATRRTVRCLVPPLVTEEQLHVWANQYGEVLRLRLTGRRADVTFAEEDSAGWAVTCDDVNEIDGQPIAVTCADGES